MASVNKVHILGNVGNAPELRYMPNGDAACNLSIATSRSWKDKAGDKQEETEWHRCSFFGKLAEIVGQYVKKGSPLYVEGRLKTRKWTNKEGAEQQTTEILVSEMQLLGGKDSAQSEKPVTDTRTQAQRRAPVDDDVPF